MPLLIAWPPGPLLLLRHRLPRAFHTDIALLPVRLGHRSSPLGCKRACKKVFEVPKDLKEPHGRLSLISLQAWACSTCQGIQQHQSRFVHGAVQWGGAAEVTARLNRARAQLGDPAGAAPAAPLTQHTIGAGAFLRCPPPPHPRPQAAACCLLRMQLLGACMRSCAPLRMGVMRVLCQQRHLRPYRYGLTRVM